LEFWKSAREEGDSRKRKKKKRGRGGIRESKGRTETSDRSHRGQRSMRWRNTGKREAQETKKKRGRLFLGFSRERRRVSLRGKGSRGQQRKISCANWRRRKRKKSVAEPREGSYRGGGNLQLRSKKTDQRDEGWGSFGASRKPKEKEGQFPGEGRGKEKKKKKKKRMRGGVNLGGRGDQES